MIELPRRRTPAARDAAFMATSRDQWLRQGLLALAHASLAVALCGCASHDVWHGDEGQAYGVLNRSTLALLEIDRNPEDATVAAALHDACAAFVFPGFSTRTYVPAGSGDDGVLLVHDRAAGHWVGPAFYGLHETAIDRQTRTAARGLVIAVGCEALATLYESGGRLPVGNGEGSQSLDGLPDVKAYACEPGHPRLPSLAGFRVRPMPQLALGYYGRPLAPAEILATQVVRNPASVEIQSVIGNIPF